MIGAICITTYGPMTGRITGTRLSCNTTEEYARCSTRKRVPVSRTFPRYVTSECLTSSARRSLESAICRQRARYSIKRPLAFYSQCTHAMNRYMAGVIGNCLWKANLEGHGDEPRRSNHLVLTVGEYGWQYLGSIRRIARLGFPCPAATSDASTFELECFYCDKWWQVEHADNDYVGGGACVIQFPGYVIPEKSTSFSPWFPMGDGVGGSKQRRPSAQRSRSEDSRS